MSDIKFGICGDIDIQNTSDEDDIGSMKEIIMELAPMLERWFDEKLDDIEKDMQNIKPIKNGIPFPQRYHTLDHMPFNLFVPQRLFISYTATTFS